MSTLKLLLSLPNLAALVPLLLELYTLHKSGTATFDQYMAVAMKIVRLFYPIPEPVPPEVPLPVGSSDVGAVDVGAEFIAAAVAQGCSERDANALVEALK